MRCGESVRDRRPREAGEAVLVAARLANLAMLKRICLPCEECVDTVWLAAVGDDARALRLARFIVASNQVTGFHVPATIPAMAQSHEDSFYSHFIFIVRVPMSMLFIYFFEVRN